MNANILGEQIAKFRKDLNMTQEDLGRAVGISAQAVSRWECGGAPDVTLLPAVADALGVTIDALFGREDGEKINIEDAVRQRMLTIPKERRLDWLCRLVWSAAGALDADRMEDAANFSRYVNRCQMESIIHNGKTYRMLERTRIMLESGFVLGVRADDMSYAAIFPEPEAGWEPFLESNDLYRRLFALLARPHCLEVLEYLHSKPSRIGRNFMIGAVVRQTGFDAAEVEEILKALAELNILLVTELETEEDVVDSFCLYENESLVPFLYLAYYLAAGGGIGNGENKRTTPVLRGGKWKEKEC